MTRAEAVALAALVVACAALVVALVAVILYAATPIPAPMP